MLPRKSPSRTYFGWTIWCNFFCLFGLISAPPLSALSPDKGSIVGLGFTDLMNIDVITASRKEGKAFETPAAVYVITSEDIRRSGATSIPEALRLAPGLQVARVSSSDWAISSRGFNSTIANKLLVLIDGRSIYTPLFSGVFWDVQDVFVENIERIEVIRGPGATMWGANAVNGVINIIRKKPEDTQGEFAVVGAGTEERFFGGARHGGRAGDRGAYRVYGKYFRRDETRLLTGGSGNDDWRMSQGGFRADWTLSDSDLLVTQGDLYSGEKGEIRTIFSLNAPFTQTASVETDLYGGNFLSRWHHQTSETSNLQLQFYYDRSHRDIPFFFKETRDIFDLDFHYHFQWGSRNDAIWGAGFRSSTDKVSDTFSVSWDPSNETSEIYSAFLQDEVQLRENLFVTLGTKVEDSQYTHMELQPNLLLLWLPNDRNTLWGAVSRAIRAPSRFDTDVRIVGRMVPGSPPTELSLFGRKDFGREKLIAYEAGYRVRPTNRLYFDAAGFYNVYDDLQSIEPGTPYTNPSSNHSVVPFFFENNLEAESYGGELVPQWQLNDWWKLEAVYSYLHLRLYAKEGSRDFATLPTQGNNPVHQFTLRSSMNLPRSFELDGALRYVDELPNQRVPEYTVMDFRLGWKGIKNLDLDLVAQNLLEPRHREFGNVREIEQGFFARAAWHF